MTAFPIIIELKPSSELMLLGDALVRSFDGLASAIRANTDVLQRLIDSQRDAPRPTIGSPPASQDGPVTAAPARAVVGRNTEATAPAAAGPAVGAAHWATDARKDVLRRIYAASSREDILAALDDLPGVALPEWRLIQIYAIQTLHLNRDPDVAAQAKRDSIARAGAFARAMKLPPASQDIDTTTPIATDVGTIRARAATWGLRFDGAVDLATVNAHAKRIGHRPFEIEPPVMRRAG